MNTTLEREQPIFFDLEMKPYIDCNRRHCGWEYDQLQAATKKAIRERRDEAYIALGDETHECPSGEGHTFTIYTLALDSIRVHFSVEHGLILVRGYSWDIADPEDASDEGGRVYTDSGRWPSTCNP